VLQALTQGMVLQVVDGGHGEWVCHFSSFGFGIKISKLFNYLALRFDRDGLAPLVGVVAAQSGRYQEP
jgi:hypothetical protein